MSVFKESVERLRSTWDRISNRSSAIVQAWDQGMFAGSFDASIGMTRESVLSITTIFACVRIISTALATAPLELWQGVEDGDRKKLVDEPEHYLFADGGNDETTRVEYIESLLIDLLLEGDAYNWTPRNSKGRPLEFWNLEAGRVSHNRVNGEMVYYASNNINLNMPYRLYQGYDMWHLRHMSRDGVNGLNIIRSFAKTFDLAASQKVYQKALYDNGMNVSSVVETDAEMDKTEITRIEKMLEKKYIGARKSGRPLILPFNLKYRNTSLSPEDAQMIPNFNYTEREIVKIFGVPLHMVANLDKATFSNIEQQQLEFIMNTLLPWAVLICESARKHILNAQQRNRGWYYEFDLDVIQQAVLKDRFTAWQMGIQGGFLTPNEVRVAEGKKRLPGLDEPLSPLNMVGAASRKPSDPDGDPKQDAPDVPPPKKAKEPASTKAATAKLDKVASARAALLGLVADAMDKNYEKCLAIASSKPDQFDSKRAQQQATNDLVKAVRRCSNGLDLGMDEEQIFKTAFNYADHIVFRALNAATVAMSPSDTQAIGAKLRDDLMLSFRTYILKETSDD